MTKSFIVISLIKKINIYYIHRALSNANVVPSSFTNCSSWWQALPHTSLMDNRRIIVEIPKMIYIIDSDILLMLL